MQCKTKHTSHNQTVTGAPSFRRRGAPVPWQSGTMASPRLSESGARAVDLPARSFDLVRRPWYSAATAKATGISRKRCKIRHRVQLLTTNRKSYIESEGTILDSSTNQQQIWQQKLCCCRPRLWNSLPISLRHISSYGQFRRYLKNLFGI